MSYRLDPGTTLSAAFRQAAAQQIDEAVTALQEGRRESDGGAHEARKRFKRLRGLLRLVRAADPAMHREERRVRDVAKALSASRDATATVETVDRLAKASRSGLDLECLMTLRRELVARRDRMAHKGADMDEAIDTAVAALGKSRMALTAIELPDDPAAAAIVLAAGVGRTVDDAVKALGKARKNHKPDDFHALRKDVKYHEMHVRLLRDAWPGGHCPGSKPDGKLGDRLGELHDLEVLRETVDAEPLGTHEDRKCLHRIIRQEQEALGAECIEAAERLFCASAREIALKAAVSYAAHRARADERARR